MKINRIGFVGVGRMGANMARRLHECGFSIAAVFDTNTLAAQELARELECAAVEQLKQVTALSDVIITVVSDDRAMKHVFNGGLLNHSQEKLFINCATLTPQVHQWAAKKCESKGAYCLEACMASSIPQAREGRLYLMCGGNPKAFDYARPLLEKLSLSVRYIGAAGKAAEVKALVNMVMNCNTAALAEGLGLGDALGIDLEMLREVFAETGANSEVLRTDGEDMQNRNHACFFSAEHAAKDSGIAIKLAKDQGLRLPLAMATKRQYDRMTKKGLAGLDKSGIAELTFEGRLGRD